MESRESTKEKSIWTAVIFAFVVCAVILFVGSVFAVSLLTQEPEPDPCSRESITASVEETIEYSSILGSAWELYTPEERAGWIERLVQNELAVRGC